MILPLIIGLAIVFLKLIVHQFWVLGLPIIGGSLFRVVVEHHANRRLHHEEQCIDQAIDEHQLPRLPGSNWLGWGNVGPFISKRILIVRVLGLLCIASLSIVALHISVGITTLLTVT